MSVHGGIRFGDERLYKPFPSQDPTLRLSFRPVPQTVDGIHRSNQQAHALFSLTCLCKCLFYVPMRTCVYKTGNAGLPHSEVTFVFRVCAALLGVGQTDAALCLKLFYFQSFLSVTGLRKLGAGGGGTSPHVDVLCNTFSIQHNHTTFRPSAPPSQESWPIN